MPRASFVRSSDIVKSPRVMQLEGIFDIPPSDRSELSWDVSLPLDERPWNIGLIVGPSGCGKSTIAREMFGDVLVSGHEWDSGRSIVDSFPAEMGIKEITALLCSVGFSSPPSWLRPFGALSNGEQFRVTIARALAESQGLVAIDEFTSVVDRTVAQIGSAAIAKTVRRSGKHFIAVGCHYDVIDWLQPDWIYEPHTGEFAWRSLQRRPAIELEIVRVHYSTWKLFKHHHYLTGTINTAAKCFVALYQGQPVAFTSAIPFAHAQVKDVWRGHRTVCLPDYQGIGIGNALVDYVASLFKGYGKHFHTRIASPQMIAHRAASPLWKLTQTQRTKRSVKFRQGSERPTVAFAYVGPAAPKEEAIRALS